MTQSYEAFIFWSWTVHMWHCVELPVPPVFHHHVIVVFLWWFWAILHYPSGMLHQKHITWLADVTSLNDAVTSYMMSLCHMCVGHVTFYYKRPCQIEGGLLVLLAHQV